MLELLAKKLGKNPEEIDVNIGFFQLGIESIGMIELIEELQTQFGDLPPTLLFDYPDVKALVDYLAEKQ